MADLIHQIRYFISIFVLVITDMITRDVAQVQKRLCKENNGFGPVFKERDGKWRISLAEAFVALIFFMILMVCRFFSGVELIEQQRDVYLFCTVIFACFTTEMLRRLCFFAEEVKHVESRYSDGGKWKAFTKCMKCGNYSILTVLVFYMVVGGGMIHGWLGGVPATFNIILYIIATSTAHIFIYLMNMRSISSVEITEMEEAGNRNIASGLVWSYYFGYLKIILPQFLDVFLSAKISKGAQYGIDNRDICDLIPVKNRKLYIIISKDAYCRDFTELDDRIKMKTKMPEQLRSRGGVSQRPYSNTLYEIAIGDEVRYVVMEYASNVSGMYDMTQHANANFNDEDRFRQVVEYYKLLFKILNEDPECRGVVELVLIGNTAKPSANGFQYDGKKLADIIWDLTVPQN